MTLLETRNWVKTLGKYWWHSTYVGLWRQLDIWDVFVRCKTKNIVFVSAPILTTEYWVSVCSSATGCILVLLHYAAFDKLDVMTIACGISRITWTVWVQVMLMRSLTFRRWLIAQAMGRSPLYTWKLAVEFSRWVRCRDVRTSELTKSFLKWTSRKFSPIISMCYAISRWHPLTSQPWVLITC